MPDGRTMQIGTIHLLGESFARTFDIQYEDKDGSLKFVNQTCYGISERCVASVIAIHGDDHGLVLPPAVAPIQVVIVPILFSSKDEAEGEQVEGVCFTVHAALKNAGIRAFVDTSDERPGAKYYRWEMKGVPLRIEIGPRDLRNNCCECVRRTDFKRVYVPLSEVVPEVRRILLEIHEGIHGMAKETLRTSIYKSEGISADVEELRRRAGHGIVSLFLCESERCGNELEEQLGVSVLGAVYEPEASEKNEGECFICSRAARRVYVARAY
jgi:prolyl-tRNA synthetase